MNKRSDVPILAISCREASRLASEALDRELTRRERWALRIHTWLCHGCRRFVAQISTMRDAIVSLPDGLRKEWFDGATKLSVERRAKIKRLLAEASKADSGN